MNSSIRTMNKQSVLQFTAAKTCILNVAFAATCLSYIAFLVKCALSSNCVKWANAKEGLLGVSSIYKLSSVPALIKILSSELAVDCIKQNGLKTIAPYPNHPYKQEAHIKLKKQPSSCLVETLGALLFKPQDEYAPERNNDYCYFLVGL